VHENRRVGLADRERVAAQHGAEDGLQTEAVDDPVEEADRLVESTANLARRVQACIPG
jgi:hypothetical protein